MLEHKNGMLKVVLDAKLHYRKANYRLPWRGYSQVPTSYEPAEKLENSAQ
jgi:hypothetical protein